MCGQNTTHYVDDLPIAGRRREPRAQSPRTEVDYRRTRMDEVLIRGATNADLPRIGAIWYQAATEGEGNPPPPGVPSLYLHELETQELVVLERHGAVVAYGAVIN